MTNEALARVQTAIDAVKLGKMVIMIDDEDRENEGDLVFAGALSTPQAVNFMAVEARGLICAAIEKDRAERLKLAPMVEKNTSGHETAFTVSIDAKSAATGISAYERHETIALLSSDSCRADDFARPGHIFPLIAKDGGVLVRIGHTEGAVDLCRLAGLAPCGVICEIMNADGAMARRGDLDKFSAAHNIPIVYIADLIEYRLLRETLIRKISVKSERLFGFDVSTAKWEDHLGQIHISISFGEIKADTNAKFHISSGDFDLLLNDRKFTGLLNAIEYLKARGGVLLLIGNGGKNSKKEIGIGAQILFSLGVKRLTLLATHEFSAPALSGFGLEVTETKLL